VKAASRKAIASSRFGSGRGQDSAVARRDASLCADGIGASSRWRVFGFALVATLLLTGVVAASAFASKEVVNYFGNLSGSGSAGGELSTPRDVAVNQSTGDVYVVDEGNNRVQRFDSDGKFISAWGTNVIRTDESQFFYVVATGGTYTLTFDGKTTTSISYNASSFTVQSRLRALSSIGSSNVNVTGTASTAGLTVNFTGSLVGTDLEQLTVNTEDLTGPTPEAFVSTLANGSGGSGSNYEVCAVASNCATGIAAAGDGTTAGDGDLNSPQSIAVDQDTGDVYVSDRNNFRVNEYEGDGTFVRSFGWDVVASGPDNLSNEIQTVTVKATSGKYTLAFGVGGPGISETNEIEYNATAAEVEAELDALENVNTGGGSVSVSGGPGDEDGARPYIVTFDGGPLAHTDVAALTASNISLAGGSPSPDATVATTSGGGSTGYEICAAADVCKSGLSGSGAGQVGSTSTTGTLGVAVSQPDGNEEAGTVFLADSQNRRVNTYDVDGTSPSSFGSSAVFGTTEPRKLAVDSRGIVYASDTSKAESIERYDTKGEDGPVGFIEPIFAPGNEVQIIHFEGFEQTSPRERYRLTCPNGEKTDETFYLTGPQGPANVESVLNRSCGENSFTASGNPPTTTVTFEGVFAHTNVPPIECESTFPEGLGGTCSITTVTDGFLAPLLEGNGTGISTSGLAVDPDSDGAGPEKDILDVLRNPAAGPTVVEQFGPTNEPGLAATPTEVDEYHGENAGFDFVNGLGINYNTGKLYVTGTSNIAGLGAGSRVYVLADPASIPSPGLVIDPVTTKTDTTATFSGTVEPMGGLVSCDFEYSTDQSSWTKVSANGRQQTGILNGSTTISGTSGWTVGQPITSSDGGIPPNTTVTEIGNGTITISNAATTSGPVLLTSPGCATLDTNGHAQAISVHVTGLDPNTHYFVRLSASRPLVPNSTTTTANVQPFDTEAVPPVITNVGAINPSDTSVRLAGTVDPRHSETGYIFEYGTTPGLGKSTPPLDIGAGTSPIAVSQIISGLTPDTAYYFRMVATNLAGTTTSAGHTFRTRATPPTLPQGRATEMVSAPDKNYSSINTAVFGPHVGVSIDGNAVGVCTSALFGEQPGNMEIQCANYLIRRTESGWETINPTPPHCHFDVEGGEGTVWAFPSADFTRFVDLKDESAACPIGRIDETAPLGPGGEETYNLYLQDFTTDPVSYYLLNPELGGFGGYGNEELPIAGSDNFSHVVYESLNNQTEYPGDSPAPGKFRKLYDWEMPGEGSCLAAKGCLTLITKDTNDVPFATPSNMPVIGGFGSYLTNSVSSNGDRIYFQNPVSASTSVYQSSCGNAGCELYMREDGEVTYDVSAPECEVLANCESPASKADFFLSSTPSGDEAFFASCAKLTDASSPQGTCTGPVSGITSVGANGSKLYRWERNAPPGHHLADLTVDHEAGDGVQPNFRGLLGESADGETAYFVTAGQIISGEPTTPGEKIYRWDDNEGAPTVEYLGSVSDIVALDFKNERRVLVTPNGEDLLIYTRDALDPAADTDTDADAYRWDKAHGWICVSCQEPGVPSGGDVDLRINELENFINVPLSNTLGSSEPKYFMDNEGNVFFGTPDALVPQDVNGEGGCPLDILASAYEPVDIYTCEDVYEWHDGTVSLISSGTGAHGAQLISTTPSGNDVFYYTDQRLVGWDVDNNVDIYDARVGGGFPEPPAQPPSCEGEACRNGGSSPLNIEGAGTAVFEGPTNPTPTFKCKKGRVRRHGKCVKKKKHHRKRHNKRHSKRLHRRAAHRARRAHR
jgi:NHL repeat